MEVLNPFVDNNIVCFSTSDWNEPFGSRQHIMSALSHNNRVLFIEPQISVLHILVNPQKQLKKIFRWLGVIRKNKNLYIYTPIPSVPFANYSVFINKVNLCLLLLSLRLIMQKFNFTAPILWVYWINAVPLLGKLGERFTVYHCIDAFSSEKPSLKRQDVLEKLEKELLQKVDFAITCTRTLYEKHKLIRQDIHFLRNGVDAVFIANEPLDIFQKDLKHISMPRIGFIGTLDARINLELILFIAQQRNKWQLVFIGTNLLSMKSKHLFKSASNLHFIGFREHKTIAEYIRSFDVCFIPYRENRFTSYIFPLKTLEYLVAGKPVVATYLTELEEFKEVVTLVHTKEEFLNAIEFHLEFPGDPARRKAVAMAHSWPNKIRWLELTVQAALNAKGKSDKQYCC